MPKLGRWGYIVKLSLLAAASALTLLGFGSAQAATTIVVPGTSNPFLAGAGATDTVTMNGVVDTAPAESPPSIAVTPGRTYQVTYLSGMVNHGPCCMFEGPNGESNLTSSFPVTATGFAELVNGFTNLPFSSLIGVFTGASPGSNVFEIGTGGKFTAPAGATELNFATVDSYEWNNNQGAFTISVAAVPEPASWTLMVFGVAAIGAGLRMTTRRQAKALAA